MKVRGTVVMGTMVIALGMCDAFGEEVTSANVVGYSRPPRFTMVTGELAQVMRSTMVPTAPVRQLSGTRIPVVIRGLENIQWDTVDDVAGSGVWALVREGQLSEVSVGGVPLALASQSISNGLVRTKAFGNWWLYAYNADGPYALVCPSDQCPALEKWIVAEKRITQAEPQGGGYSPPAARSAQPTP